MNSARLLVITLTLSALVPALPAADKAPPAHAGATAVLTKAEQKFLANYEGVRAALASDNLDAAKRSAANLGDSPGGAEVARAATMQEARVAFRKLSAEAIPLAKGREGYFIATCPMARADWVQTTKAISNPYYGKSMLTCGSIKP